MDRAVSRLSDGVWPPAVLAAVASWPFSFGIHRYAPIETSIAVFLAGTCVGYYYRQDSKRAIRVGTRMGLVGALPSLWVYAMEFGLLASIDPTQSAWTTAVEVGPLLGLLLLVAGLSMLQGFVGTLAGVKTIRQQSSADTA